MGPMAKPHRMFTLTLGCLLSTVETFYLRPGAMLWAALIVINVGSMITVWRRTASIVRELETR